MQIWSRFWKWYEDKILGSIIIIAIIQFIQIPHMVWNADLYLQTGVISRLHPALDWLLYGVDLIEIVSILRFRFFLISSPGRKYSIIGSNHLKTITGIIKSINTNVKNIHHANGSRVRNRV